MSMVIRRAGLAVTAYDREVPPGSYLKSCDLEFADGAGLVTWTPHRSQALVFGSYREAFEAWRAVPECCPLRDDGEPNRPLTAFTVEIEEGPS